MVDLNWSEKLLLLFLRDSFQEFDFTILKKELPSTNLYVSNWKYLTYFLKNTSNTNVHVNGIFQDNEMTQKIFPIFSTIQWKNVYNVRSFLVCICMCTILGLLHKTDLFTYQSTLINFTKSTYTHRTTTYNEPPPILHFIHL